MALALIPIAGYALGYMAYGTMGAAIGWMIGSWLMNSKSKTKNQIFDPGAQELPRPNNALRGSTMAVIFGTNRVSSQITWQNNFQTIRQETRESGGGGGKGGGSGMGKGGGGSNSSNVSYTYKIDAMYHLGMVPEAYNLFGGWVGSQRLNDQTIAAISMNFASTSLIFTGASGTKSASLVFDDAVYMPGDHPAVGSWSYFDGVAGHTLSFPRTSWVGFRALNLGGSPSLPQISWEIGPGGVALTIDSGVINTFNHGGITPVVDIGNPQWTRGNQVQLSYVTNEATFYRRTDDAGLSLARITPASHHAFVLTRFPAYNGGTNFYVSQLNERYCLSQSIDIVISLRTDNVWVLWELSDTEDGDPTPLACFMYQGNGSELVSTLLMTDIAGLKTNNDPILQFFDRQVSTFHNVHLLQLPSINGMIRYDGVIVVGLTGLSGSYSWPRITFQTTFGDSWGVHNGLDSRSRFGWLLPIVNGLAVETDLLFHVTKTQVEHNLSQPYIVATAAAYPNGHILKVSLGFLDDVVFGAGFHLGNLASDPPATPINDKFVDATGVQQMPFDDARVNRDGSTPESGTNDYSNVPGVQMIRGGVAAGGVLETFTLNYETVTNTSPTGHWIKVRVIVYNPLTGIHVQYGAESGSCFDPVAEGWVIEANRYNFSLGKEYQVAFADFNTNELFMLGGFTKRGIVAKFGDLDLHGGVDVTPPYIIRQILVNEFFGIYPGRDDLINETSYGFAVQYCESEDFKISTQYRREEDWTDIVELLLAVYGGYLIFSGGQFKFGFSAASTVQGAGTSVRTIDNHHLLVKEPGQPPVQITRGALQDTYNKIRVNYIDRALDYNQNQIEEGDEVDQDLHGIRLREFPPQFIMNDRLARKIALRGLWTNMYVRDSYTFFLGPKDHDLEPGEVVTLVDSFWPELAAGQRCRIVTWNEIERLKFQVTAVQEIDFYMTSVTSVQATTDISSRTIIGPAAPAKYTRAYELPAEFSNEPQVFIGWVPSAYTYGARLYVSADDVSYAPALNIQPYPLAGQLAADLNVGNVFNESVTIRLFPSSSWNTSTPAYDMLETLNEVSLPAMHNGLGLLWVGSEMLAYEGVTLVAQNEYKLSRVYRGWGGTNQHAHSSGDFFWKAGGGIFTQAYNEDKIGTTFHYKVVPYNLSGAEYDVSSVEAGSYTIEGRYYRPQNPSAVQFVNSAGVAQRSLNKFFVGSTVDVAIGWKDSARLAGYGVGGYGIGGYGRFTTDVLSHAWRVEVVGSGGVTVHSTVVSTSSFTYPQSLNVAQNGAYHFRPAFRVTPFGAYGDAIKTSVLSLELWQ